MLDTTKKFELGNTIYFECLYRNINGYPADPSSSSWTIESIKGATIDSGSPRKRDTGLWYCFYTPETVGDYVLIFTGTIEENAVTIRRKFKVVEIRLK